MTDHKHERPKDPPCPICGVRGVEVIEYRTDGSVIHQHYDGRRCIDPLNPPKLHIAEDD